MATMSVYENLYTTMKNKFAVINDGIECTLGEYMVKKASGATSNLPAARANDNHSISAIISYVNDKLAVKKEPVKDKTMRAFPLRTSLSAFFSAVVACVFIFSFGIFAMKGASSLPSTVDARENIEETEIVETVDKTND
ncbi:MAG: hypothetical protein IJD51_03085 [Clostridia bacterium]|nr:hypothetical protein [Clostridia bacterium]